MFAVIETGGKQYKVAAGQKIEVETLAGDAGASVVFDKVLLVGEGESAQIGAPYVSGATVEGKIVSQMRDDKKIVFRYHSKTRYRKMKGHRQPLTQIEIVGIKK